MGNNHSTERWALAFVFAGLGLFNAGTAIAQSAEPNESAPSKPTERRNRNDVSRKVIPGLVKPAAPSGRNGPLAPIADRLAEDGITLSANSIDFFTANPSVGLLPGNSENSLYNILGVDLDLSKRTDLTHSSLHYQTTIFALNTNFGFLGQTGDTLVGYQGTYNKRTAVISVATFEQKAFDDRLDFEIGRTHPNRYYATPQCSSLDSCFQDILYYNAGFTSPLYSVWGANLRYQVTPTLYAEAGAFSTNDAVRIGYDLGKENNTGALVLAEIGNKTGFDTDRFPSTVSLTGFVNTAPHLALNSQVALGQSPAFTEQGTSGIVFNAQKIVWRADGGAENNLAPTAISVYGSAGAGLDSTTPISTSIFVGATLQAPFEGRPLDRFGIKFNYERLNNNYADYLNAANFASGGSGAGISRDKYVFEANAHIQLPYGLAFEPVVQYVINPNSFYYPFTSLRPRDGVFAIGTLIIPVGTLLGLTPG